MDKQKALEAALSQIEKNFGKGSIMRLGANDRSIDVEAVPTGSLGLDIALGVCAIEICGHDWGGPTINLSVDFLQGAPMGDWIESRVILEHTTRTLMFVTGSVVGSPGMRRGSKKFSVSAAHAATT